MRPIARRLALLVVPAVALACAESVNGPAPRGPAGELATLGVAAPRLVSCAAPPTVASGETTMGESGGSFAVGRRRLRVPSSALHQDARIQMATPATSNVMVELHVAGYSHFTFDRPVTVTIDFSRCTTQEVPASAPLRVVYVDPVTLDILEDMGGVVDPDARTITFETGHFSTYAVAY